MKKLVRFLLWYAWIPMATILWVAMVYHVAEIYGQPGWYGVVGCIIVCWGILSFILYLENHKQ